MDWILWVGAWMVVVASKICGVVMVDRLRGANVFQAGDLDLRKRDVLVVSGE